MFSLINDQDKTAIYETSITDVILPNSMFINGIVLDLRETQACQASEQGKMNYIYIYIRRLDIENFSAF